jgi:ketopantoate hydroxymethyltransferase
MRETSCHAIKLETAGGCGRDHCVPGSPRHSLRPQAANLDDRFKAKSRSAEAPEAVLAEARAVDQAGAFAMVVWRRRSPAASPVGIGASLGCDGQILVTDDMIGTFDWTPKCAATTRCATSLPKRSKLMRPTCQAARFRCPPKCTALPRHQRRSGHERKYPPA